MIHDLRAVTVESEVLGFKGEECLSRTRSLVLVVVQAPAVLRDVISDLRGPVAANV